MSPFQTEYTPRAQRDLEKLRDDREAVKIIDEATVSLSANPFPSPPRKKKIRGLSTPLFRLRIDTRRDSYRIFYIFRGSVVTILRVVKKKDADRIIRTFR